MFELGKLHQGLTYEQYDAQEGLRSSTLKLLKRSPAHYKAAIENPKEPSKALRLGKAVHGFLEQGKDFLSKYAVEPVFTGYTKKGEPTTNPNALEVKQKKAEWYEALGKDVTVLDQEQHEQLLGILNAIGEHKFLKKLLKDGMRETSLWVRDPETDLVLKCRPDFISTQGYMIDFKTSRDATQSFFHRQIFSHRNHENPFYILQAAHYAHCARLAGLERPDSFTFVVVENTKPYGIKIYPMDTGCIEYGEQWRRPLTELFKKCIENNNWPCYEEDATQLMPPSDFDLNM